MEEQAAALRLASLFAESEAGPEGWEGGAPADAFGGLPADQMLSEANG